MSTTNLCPRMLFEISWCFLLPSRPSHRICISNWMSPLADITRTWKLLSGIYILPRLELIFPIVTLYLLASRLPSVVLCPIHQTADSSGEPPPGHPSKSSSSLAEHSHSSHVVRSLATVAKSSSITHLSPADSRPPSQSPVGFASSGSSWSSPYYSCLYYANTATLFLCLVNPWDIPKFLRMSFNLRTTLNSYTFLLIDCHTLSS